MSKIDLRIGEMFQGDAWLTVLLYEGRLDRLTRDLTISEGVTTPPRPIINIEVVMSLDLVVLCVVMGMICTLVGVVTTFLIMRSKWRIESQGK